MSTPINDLVLPDAPSAPAPLPVTVRPSGSALKPTPQQAAFLDALASTDRNICLQARAGCGKTSAILMGVDAYLSRFPGAEVLVCAFNKSIQTEVSEKLTARGYDWKQVGCQTVHSMGMSLLKYAFRPKVDEHKVWDIIDNLRLHEQRTHPLHVFGSTIKSLVGLAKQSGVGFFDEAPIPAREVWYTIADHYDVDPFGDVDMEAVVTEAIKVYRVSLDDTSTIDFDDMVFLPLYHGMRVKFTKDLVLGDEVQDWSPIRAAIVKMYCKRGTGRIAIVGDDRQAIYGWSGADAQAMGNLTRELDAITLPLSVTWRCPKAVVELAQRIVPDLEAAPSAPEGQVLSQLHILSRQEAEKLQALHPGYVCLEDLTPNADAILCRNNAPLVPLAYRVIRAGIPAKVEGRKIGEGLQELVNRWKVKTTSALRNRILDWRDRETQKLSAKGKEQKAAEIEDRALTLLEIVQECERRGRHDVESVVAFIDQLFGDDVRGAVTLSSYHKSKGREWDRVFLLEHYSRCPSKAARQEWQKVQEANVAYVALTRAKRVLVFVG